MEWRTAGGAVGDDLLKSDNCARLVVEPRRPEVHEDGSTMPRGDLEGAQNLLARGRRRIVDPHAHDECAGTEVGGEATLELRQALTWESVADEPAVLRQHLGAFGGGVAVERRATRTWMP